MSDGNVLRSRSLSGAKRVVESSNCQRHACSAYITRWHQHRKSLSIDHYLMSCRVDLVVLGPGHMAVSQLSQGIRHVGWDGHTRGSVLVAQMDAQYGLESANG
jgi:hypothetical protein